jgi:UPF0176 protein
MGLFTERRSISLITNVTYFDHCIEKEFGKMSTQLGNRIVIVSMYQFVRLDDFMEMKPLLIKICGENSINGTILLAHEGLNGTIAGLRVGIDNLLAYLYSDPRFKTMQYKKSFTDTSPFRRLKVRIKREIVTMGVPEVDPTNLSGKRVDAKQWNTLINDPDVITLDTRNMYEHEVGTFKNAISPRTNKFRDFPLFVDTNLDPRKHKRIAMFCTGGIRCEKASNYMLKKGFEEVYHLDGGVLKYLETVNKKDNLWLGECFVFDERVAVNKDLMPGSYVQCHACRMPLRSSDLKSSLYEVGISCHNCHGKHGAKKIEGLKERQRQFKMINLRKKI